MIFKSNKKVLELLGAHFSKVHECYSLFDDFMMAYYDDDAEAKKCYECLDRLEKEADNLRTNIVEELMSGKLLPGTRSEILKLSGMIDTVANRAQDVARQIVLEHVVLPTEFEDDLVTMAHITLDQLEKLMNVVQMLFESYETLVSDQSVIDEVRDFESEVDKIENKLILLTFQMDIGLAEKNHIKYFIRQIANVSDHLENIADEIQIMMVFRKV
ncbi:TIGR00153 family protein [Eubacteriales bacterium OttesenSCG-928-K08]|nr:TIGR00153 family protein [Eubacteriales bacterium OttesenSCG-928-K08]